MHPRDAKIMIAQRLVDIYHGVGTGQREADDFKLRFSAREFPDDTAEQHKLALSEVTNLQQLLLKLVAAKSSREIQRLVEQNAVKIMEGPAVVSDLLSGSEPVMSKLRANLLPGTYKIKIGKTRFAVVRLVG
jgi:tyrosyl-tRNA synthetase